MEGDLEACPAERADGAGQGSAAFSLGDDGVRCGALREPGRGTVRVGHAGPDPGARDPVLSFLALVSNPCLLRSASVIRSTTYVSINIEAINHFGSLINSYTIQ